jgi:hypothetical protein
MQLLIAPVKLQLRQSGIIGSLYEDSQRMRLIRARPRAPVCAAGAETVTRNCGRDPAERPLRAEGGGDDTG